MSAHRPKPPGPRPPARLDPRPWLVILGCRHWIQQATHPRGVIFTCNRCHPAREIEVVTVIDLSEVR